MLEHNRYGQAKLAELMRDKLIEAANNKPENVAEMLNDEEEVIVDAKVDQPELIEDIEAGFFIDEHESMVGQVD
jgi:hypothetical protein